MFSKDAKNVGRARRLKKRHKANFRTTGKGREEKTGVSSAMLKSKDKADAEFLAYLKLLEMPFSMEYEETKRLIRLLDLIESLEKQAEAFTFLSASEVMFSS